jgi:hypothetical protein
MQRIISVGGDGLPTEKAREMQRKMRDKAAVAKREKSVLEKVWMGDEDEDWKEKRLRREREVLENGEGYGTLIMDQISEVWRRDKKDGNDSRQESQEPGPNNSKNT